MVKITNGINVFKVTRGAFDSIYSKQGYEEVKSIPEPAPENYIDDKSEDEAFLDEIVEKPISQWSKSEIKRFATLKEIDISGKSVGEARDLVKTFLNECEE